MLKDATNFNFKSSLSVANSSYQHIFENLLVLKSSSKLLEMKLKQISFLLLFLVFQNVRSENEEYFEKSIIRALKDKNGHFNSEIVYVLFGNKTVREKYSFSQKSGEHFEGSEYDSYKTLYLNSTEIHTYSEKFNFCHSSKFNNYSVRNAFYSWGPTIIFNKTFTYTFLGKFKFNFFLNSNQLSLIIIYFYKSEFK